MCQNRRWGIEGKDLEATISNKKNNSFNSVVKKFH